MRVIAARSHDFGWLVERTGCVLTTDFRAIKAVDDREHIRGMVGYAGWTANSVQVHMAVESPIVWRSLLRPGFAYPFEQGGRGLILGVIAANNARSLALTRSLGFRETHRITDGLSPGVDLILFEMRRDECRWLDPSLQERAA